VDGCESPKQKCSRFSGKFRRQQDSRTRVGPFYIAERGGRYHPVFREESLGSYHSPASAADDLAGGHTFFLPDDIDSAELNCEWRPADDGLARRVCRNITMAELATLLPNTNGYKIDRPVVDLTGLSGTYDLQFEIRRQRTNLEAPTPTDDSGPTIFDGMAQIGLKLEARKQAMPVIVIDHLERTPTEN
jgi:uncharacterized protein (TIGR03435 family)